MERRQYRNPPIEEAICELRFAPGPEAEFTAPARFYESLKVAYPGKPQQQQILAAELQARPAGSQLSMRQEAAKILFPTEDGRRLVGLGINLLSVHVVRPYPGWEDFRARIGGAVQAYKNAAAPAGVTRIGLRYVNRIEVKSGVVNLGEYLTVAPNLPDGLPLNILTFVTRLEIAYADAPIIQMALTVASVEPSAPGAAAFLLDIEMKSEWPTEPLPLSDVEGVVDELRRREREAFESFITDRARELFDA